MSENNNTGCGCPCNNKNTRNVMLKTSDGVLFPAQIRSVDKHRICGARANGDACCRSDTNLRSAKSDPGIVTSGSENRLEVFDTVSCHGESDSVNFNVSVEFGNINELSVQVISPVVAEPEAVTSDAPAMTVQENTGAGAVSPSAPAQPRFVQLGASVYDRKLDRFLVAVNEAGARSIADELNVCPDRVVDFKWEDAK